MDEMLTIVNKTPTNEAQCRELVPLLDADRQACWQEVCEQAEAGDVPITACGVDCNPDSDPGILLIAEFSSLTVNGKEDVDNNRTRDGTTEKRVGRHPDGHVARR